MSSQTSMRGGDIMASAVADTGKLSRRVVVDFIALADGLIVIATMLAIAQVLEVIASGQLTLARIVQTSLLAGVVSVLYLKGAMAYDFQGLLARTTSPTQILLGVTIGVLAAVGAGIGDSMVRLTLVVWSFSTIAIGTLLLVGARFLAHKLLGELTEAGRFDTRVAIYGAGPIAERARDYLAGGPAGTHFAGIFDDRADPDRRAGHQREVNGTLDDLIKAGRADLVDLIVVALPASASDRLSHIVKRLTQLPVSIHVCTHVASDIIDANAPHRVSSLGPLGLLDVKSRPFSDWGVILKLIEDRVLGVLLFVLTAPLLALVALAVRLDSKGPVLFRQRRHGLNRRVIEVLKFRTMTTMEDGAAVRQATRDDPRVTRVGRFLRRTSLDELPQLWNVLKGEMSLVGPRPHAIVHDDHYGQLIETYANRHRVKPGMTGLAQVEGLRGETDTPEKMKARVERDLAYIDNWSLSLDLKILAKTAWIIFTGRNAY